MIAIQNLHISHAKNACILVVFYKIICQIQFCSVRNQSVYNDIL